MLPCSTCAELVLRIVLDGPDLQVTGVRTQVFLEDLVRRSVAKISSMGIFDPLVRKMHRSNGSIFFRIPAAVT